MNRGYLLGLITAFLLNFALVGCSHHSATTTQAAIAVASPTPSAKNYTPRVLAKADAPDGHFQTVGSLATFRWTPPTYTTGFEYDLYYYIPPSVGLHPEKPVKSILFMHGGGQSTMTREGSTWAVSLYVNDFIKIANDQNAIVVFPSASGLNWGGHTRVMIRELAKFMKANLPIDPDSMALIGHSMGGMGITRNAFFLGDQFAFIMPIAAGMDPVYMTDINLLTFFNTPYHHIQGINDEFDVFVERAKMHAAKMKELEDRLGLKSMFELTLTNTGHQYDLEQLDGIIADQFSKSTRNLYQRDLYGSFFYANQIITDNNIQYDYTSTPDYFWLEAKEFTPTEKTFRSPFEAHITGNQVWINFKGPHNVKTLRVFLSKKMVDFRIPVSIIVNGQRLSHRFAFSDKSDNGFEYDRYVDVDVSGSQTPPVQN